MTSRVALLVLVAFVCMGFAAGEVPTDCCLTVTDKRFPHQRVLGYSIQDVGKGCAIRATVLVTKGGWKLCVPHPSDSDWVTHVIDRVKTKGAQK